MKKALSVIVVLLCCVAMHAQSHFKFMGIPINGNINSFTQKLVAKGFKKLPSSEQPQVSAIALNGMFSGEYASIQALFTNKTKTVYGIGIMIDCLSDADALKKFEKYEKNFIAKYGADTYEQRPSDNTLKTSALRPQDGHIIIAAMKRDYYPYNYILAITYIDKINYDKYQKENLEDL